MANIDVKQVVESQTPIESPKKVHFIKNSGIDSDSAYERLKLLKEHKSLLKRQINATNTAMLPMYLVEEYDKLGEQFDKLIKEEKLLITIG